MIAYYNEWDKNTAAWLRELITMELISEGVVDERSITELKATDLVGYDHVSLFAVIGGWDYSLRLAGWSGPVWTISCPCQPFSVAGKGKGSDDDRNLWHEAYRLIRECRAATIFGEQVTGAIQYGWLDRVLSDLEAEGYACGSAVLPAASVGKAHKRDRIFWVAQPIGIGRRGWSDGVSTWNISEGQAEGSGNMGIRIPDPSNEGHQRCIRGRQGEGRENIERHSGCSGAIGDVYLDFIDGKKRRIESGIKPLVDGIPRGVVHSSDICDAKNTAEARVKRLKGYGNAIVPQVAAEFIKAFMSLTP